MGSVAEAENRNRYHDPQEWPTKKTPHLVKILPVQNSYVYQYSLRNELGVDILIGIGQIWRGF